MIRMLVLALAALAACPAAPARASEPLVRIDVVDRDTGQWLPGHPHRRETWVAGTPGHRYAVRLTNTTGERVLAVLSVDGVNAVTGETAHPSQTGYVLAPYQSAEIAGWRKSYQDIAQFVFTSLPDSYAARTGRPDNVGTIGVAVFRERVHVRPYPPYPLPSPPVAQEGRGFEKARGAAPAAEAAQPADGYDAYAQQRIGTGHGQREWAPASQASFVRASRHPAQVTQLRYDAPEALARRGITPYPDAPHWSHRGRPQAFPGGFVADPPDRWR